MDDDKDCIVCFEKGNDLINYNHCNNCFIHKGCLKKWFIQNKNLCFICKKKIYKDEDLNNLQLILKVFDIEYEESDIENNINREIIQSNIPNNQFIFYDNHSMVIQTNENINCCTRFLVSFLFFTFLFSLFYIILN